LTRFEEIEPAVVTATTEKNPGNAEKGENINTEGTEKNGGHREDVRQPPRKTAEAQRTQRKTKAARSPKTGPTATKSKTNSTAPS
jgi:hypothetical protein